MALYAENASVGSITEAAALFKDAIDCNAHAGDSWTMYRAAVCLEDAVCRFNLKPVMEVALVVFERVRAFFRVELMKHTPYFSLRVKG
jgi:hypothetical protein